jgi:hypothetical protein
MALLWLSCPHCRILFHIDGSAAGAEVACPACGGTVPVPAAAPAAPRWYYAVQGQPVGPATLEQLQLLAASGRLLPTDLVWQEGTPGWVAARSVERLFSAAPPLALPAAVPVAKEAPPPVAELVDEPLDDVPIEVLEELPREPEPPPPAEVEEPPAVAPSEPIFEVGPREATVSVPPPQEEPIHVDPEFHLDLSQLAPPSLRATPPPAMPLPVEAEFELVDNSPKLDVPSREPNLELDGQVWPDQDLGPARKRSLELFPEAPEEIGRTSPSPLGPEPGTYPIQGEARPASHDSGPPASRQPRSEDIAPVPLAGLVPPALPSRPRDERERSDREVSRRRRMAAEIRNWPRVSSGINLLYWAMLIGTVAILLAIILTSVLGFFTAEAAGGQGAPAWPGFLLGLVALLLVVALLADSLSIVGYSLCLFVPVPGPPKVLAIASLVLAACTILGGIVAAFVPALRPVVYGTGFARWIVFLFFVRAVGHALESRHMIEDSESLLLLSVGGVVAWIAVWAGMSFLVAKMNADKPDAGVAEILTLVCGAVCTVVPLVILGALIVIRYIRLLRDSSALIDQKLYRG